MFFKNYSIFSCAFEIKKFNKDFIFSERQNIDYKYRLIYCNIRFILNLLKILNGLKIEKDEHNS